MRLLFVVILTLFFAVALRVALTTPFEVVQTFNLPKPDGVK